MSALTRIESALEIPGVRVLRNGMVFDGDLTPENLDKVFRFLSTVDSCRLWWWGDFLNVAGDRARAYRQAMDDSGYEFQTLANAKFVCDRVKTSCRHEVLSFSHYYEIISALGKGAEDEHIRRWERWTVENGQNGKPASKMSLRRALRASLATSSDDFIPIPTFCALSRRFEGMVSGLDAARISDPDAERILSDLRPILIFADSLRARIRADHEQQRRSAGGRV